MESTEAWGMYQAYGHGQEPHRNTTTTAEKKQAIQKKIDRLEAEHNDLKTSLHANWMYLKTEGTEPVVEGASLPHGPRRHRYSIPGAFETASEPSTIEQRSVNGHENDTDSEASTIRLDAVNEKATREATNEVIGEELKIAISRRCQLLAKAVGEINFPRAGALLGDIASDMVTLQAVTIKRMERQHDHAGSLLVRIQEETSGMAVSRQLRHDINRMVENLVHPYSSPDKGLAEST